MRNIFKIFGAFALASASFIACEDAEYGKGGKDGDSLGVHAFFAESINSSGIASTIVKLTPEEGAKVVLTPTLTDKMGTDVSFMFKIDQSALDTYNNDQGTGYKLIDESLVDLGGEIRIEAGKYSADAAIITLDKITPELAGQPLALPVRLVNTSGNVDVTANTSAYVFVITSPMVYDLPQFNGAAALWVENFNQTFTEFTVEMKLQVSNTSNRNRDIFFVKGLDPGKELMFRFEDPQSADGNTPAHSLVQFQGIGDYLNPGNDYFIRANKWQHYAVTYDGTNITIYVNGVEAGSKAVTASVVNNGVLPGLSFMGVGGSNGAWAPGDSWWYGCKTMATECRIWSVCRTGDQIAKNMQSVVPDTKGLEGYWRVSKATYNEETKEFEDLTGKGHPMTTTKTFVWNEGISSEDEETVWK